MKRIAILGSTGSIGTQALDVIEQHSDLFEAYVLTANNNVELLVEQARRFQPEMVVIANEQHYDAVQRALSNLPIKVYAGADALCEVVQDEGVDIVLASMVGFAGLRPTISAIKAGKPYLIKWNSGSNIVSPTFTKVTIAGGIPQSVQAQSTGFKPVSFVGHYTVSWIDGWATQTDSIIKLIKL